MFLQMKIATKMEDVQRITSYNTWVSSKQMQRKCRLEYDRNWSESTKGKGIKEDTANLHQFPNFLAFCSWSKDSFRSIPNAPLPPKK